MENEKELVTQNDTETTENNGVEINLEEEIVETDDVEALKKALATSKAQKDHWKKKATILKQEVEVKTEIKKPTEKKSDLTQREVFALISEKVHKDDVDEIVDYARLKNISVEEALKSGIVKTIIREKEEQRNVANATNTGTTKRSSTKLSEDALLENASKGKLPESDDDIVRLVRARKGYKN